MAPRNGFEQARQISAQRRQGARFSAELSAHWPGQQQTLCRVDWANSVQLAHQGAEVRTGRRGQL